jgi:dienelactone hydrolase
MKRALPPKKLKEAWESITAQAGSYQRRLGTRTETQAPFTIVLVTCRFQTAPLDAKVVFDAADEVAGLFFLPGNHHAEESATPPYANRSGFDEKDIMVGAGRWALPGTLSVPKGDGPFPAIVLVHGSGPHDRDETIGPNKPFRDLAWGLASKGIAALRYEKRTKHHAVLRSLAAKSGLTANEEAVDDALAAVDLLRRTPGIAKDKIYVLGHSLGGMLVPRIGLRGKQIAGLIVLAGTTRPLEDVILQQVDYLSMLDGQISDEEERHLDRLKQQAALVKSPTLSRDTPSTELPLGIPASYWLDLRGYDPVEEAKTLQHPLLILQGERDYQVTAADFDRWHNGLQGKQGVTFRTFPNLNHLLIKGKGRSEPAEYDIPGHVDEQVIRCIVAWLERQ